MNNPIPPSLILIFGSFLIPFLKGKIKQVYLILVPLITILYVFTMQEGTYWIVKILDYELIFGRVDRLSLAFGYIFSLITLIGCIYSLHVKDNLLLMSAFSYAGGSLGAVFAGDFVTLFIFWEVMALAAAFIVWAAKTKGAISAGFRYLMVHIFGGLLLLGGIILHYHETGSLLFNYVGLSGLSSWLIFLGFGVNAAFPVLHAWLPDAYPESTESGTVFLSAYTTKTAVYVLARGFPGTELLIYIGALMTAFPIFYAVIENNLRRVLSYSLINQVGFMVTGIGIGTQLSLNGTVAHAFCHILYKALLFMSMGAVLYRTGKINATDLGGLYKSMPLTTIFCIVGAASISGVPLTSGFVSKSMIVSASGEGGMLLIWIALLFASAGVFHHSGIKIPFFAFFSHDSGIRTQEAPKHMLVAMGMAAFLCIAIGVFPGPLYSILPYPVDYEPYTAAHVIDQTQLLAFSALAFTLLMLAGIYPPEIRSVNLDADWFYRKGAKVFMKVADSVLAKAEYNIIGQAYEKVFIRGILKIASFCKLIDTSGVDGTYNGMARSSLRLSDAIKVIQTGKAHDYAFLMLIGILILFLIIFIPFVI
ncbi:Na(+)/H(+) antiporter subunit D [Thermodesulfovibrio hydrogeniphilus]